jgi:hypothetical protein
MLYEYNIVYDPKTHRLRCQGHIINLSVNSFLYVTDDENVEGDEEHPTQLNQTLKDIEQWRKYGPIGKLYNIIVDIQSSAQKMQEFLNLSRKNRPSRDNKTRWGSMALMIKKAITSPVFEAIKAYVRRHSSEGVGEDELSDTDWNTLQKIHEFLDQLHQTTLALESSVSTFDHVLPAMDFILEQFEQYKEKYKGDKTMGSMFNSGWAKMEKYYRMTDESPAYTTGLVLDPNSKWAYIENNWKKEWVPNARIMMDKLWEEYKPGMTTATLPSSTCTYDVDPRSWWLEKTQQTNYPNLSKLALDILSVSRISIGDQEHVEKNKMNCLQSTSHKERAR